ncbi:hypothetical protein [Paenibacillus puldeungensis]|uniref:hypothetical protein n=1 Tax=Paenibacillus puldeungensis TaxID=696536 RepID=UPI0036D42AD1
MYNGTIFQGLVGDLSSFYSTGHYSSISLIETLNWQGRLPGWSIPDGFFVLAKIWMIYQHNWHQNDK